MSKPLVDWLLYGFFFGGAAGGWLLLGILGSEIWRKFRS